MNGCPARVKVFRDAEWREVLSTEMERGRILSASLARKSRTAFLLRCIRGIVKDGCKIAIPDETVQDAWTAHCALYCAPPEPLV